MMAYSTVIIGGGIAGLGAASISPNESIVLEKNNYLGGLCNSFSIDGFTFDRAIHLSFTNNEMARSVFNKTLVYEHFPESYNFYNNLWMKHPVQFNLKEMNLDFKVDALESYMRRDMTLEALNYKEWLYSQYGEVIADKFPCQYTKKYWRKDASELTLDWVSNRMSKISLKEIINGMLSEDTGHNYYVNEMRYPREGGYFKFLSKMIENTNYKLESEVVGIDVVEKTVTLSSEETFGYESLISTIPLNELVRRIKNVPLEVLTASNKLEYTSVYIVSVGFDQIEHINYPWYYVYDDDILAARIHSPRWKSKNNVPRGKDSIQMEIHTLCNENIAKEDLMENINYSLTKLGYTIENIKFIDIKKEQYANVVFNFDTKEAKSIILDYLDTVGILTAGRFGEWDYFWSDQSLTSGMNKGKKILKKV